MKCNFDSNGKGSLRKLQCLILATLIFLSPFTSFSVSASANVLSLPDQTGTSFLPMTPEQYDALIDMLHHGSDDEKRFAVDYIFDRLEGDFTSYAWNQGYSISIGAGTYELYGFVSYISYYAGMYIRTVVPATLRGSNQYGYTWYTVDTDAATSLPGSGSYEYEGTVTVSIVTPQQLYIATAGNYTISLEEAESIGVDLEVCEYSYSVGTTTYYRFYDTSSQVEYSSIKV